MANTTSTEDLKKMEEDGFSISDADSHTIITVTDKIKAALAKAGVDVSSMGGTLTKEQLEEITGSPVVTQQIMDSLAANDLPATEENVQDSAEALAQAASIPEITKQAMSYLLKMIWSRPSAICICPITAAAQKILWSRNRAELILSP